MCIRDRICKEAQVNSVVIIGPNGSGKSKLGAWIEQQDFETVSYTHLDVYKRQRAPLNQKLLGLLRSLGLVLVQDKRDSKGNDRDDRKHDRVLHGLGPVSYTHLERGATRTLVRERRFERQGAVLGKAAYR